MRDQKYVDHKVYKVQSVVDYQWQIDQEALEGKCFYCHEMVEFDDATALHLMNSRGVTQHVHKDCDTALKNELLFERWQEEHDA